MSRVSRCQIRHTEAVVEEEGTLGRGNHGSDRHFSSASPSACNVPNLFPAKLHWILENAPNLGLDNVVAWSPSGDAFRVHDPRAFEFEIMPRFFPNQTRYKSFLRQLNLYRFDRLSTRYCDRGCYRHKRFIRGKPSLARSMHRDGYRIPRRQGEQPSISNLRSTQGQEGSKMVCCKNPALLGTVADTVIRPLRTKNECCRLEKHYSDSKRIFVSYKDASDADGVQFQPERHTPLLLEDLHLSRIDPGQSHSSGCKISPSAAMRLIQPRGISDPEIVSEIISTFRLVVGIKHPS